MNIKAKLYVAMVSLAGLGVIGMSLYHWRSEDLYRFCFYLILSALAAGLKVSLPGIRGTMSVCFLFVFIGIADLNATETLLIGCAGTVVQCLWKSKQRPKMFQVVFSIANTGIAVTLAYSFYHWPVLQRLDHIGPLLLIATGLAYYVLNTVPIAEVISLSEGKRFGETWHNCYFWSFPFYLVGASLAWIISLFTRQMHWQGSIVLLPVIYLIYRSYQLYLARLEDERRHVESIAGLHMRTIEALALAIEAKDHTTHEHLRRVRVYAVEIGKRLGLATEELEALKAAALLHDIGKLAVPEHIISKPGRLTQEEFEKMKIHPVVGAEILERVSFPYPVAPIVRAHHEKWDGSGYPYGLRGEEIPIGARILSAVDCLDALASDRQYRRAMNLDDAMSEVMAQAGKSFDPRVVLMLLHHYVELERQAQETTEITARLSTDVKIERGAEPATGYQGSAPHTAPGNEYDFLCSIAAARQEVQLLFELVQDLGNSLSLDETLSVVAARLKKIVPYDAIAIYVRLDRKLVPQYVNGEDFRLFSSLEIPMGEGLSGWVAENRKPILNGNPSVEPGYLADPAKFSTLRSALAVPLEGLSGAIGVMTLYRADHDAFSRDHLRILLAISSKVSLAVENALIFRQVEDSATTDYLSGLPNARSLFLRLDSEVARCKRNGEPLCVVVCDLDGFKQVNDRFGHLEGNKVLRNVADALRSRCREYDYVARMGGDEFVLLLPGGDRKSIQGRIAEIRLLAVDTSTPAGSNVSMSLGEAFFPDDGEDAEELLAEADKRMYKAKNLRKKYRMTVYPQTAPVEIAATA
ncbi:MAG: HD domain-containing phosphohydrolase [Bryobacteraceae bacterium]|jgi:diguanylate cyclase (GGDEF)-like protein/putative nucleotidyltransferase with HDIG domain